LWYLGKEGVTPSVVQAIREKLPAVEFDALWTCRKPAWMSDEFFAAEKLRNRDA